MADAPTVFSVTDSGKNPDEILYWRIEAVDSDTSTGYNIEYDVKEVDI
jgi:hypothetical protein